MNLLTVGQVQEIMDGWLESPNARIIQVSERALASFFALLKDGGMGGNLCTDALIAVHAREHSAVVCSTDRDFDRFPGLKWVNPLQ